MTPKQKREIRERLTKAERDVIFYKEKVAQTQVPVMKAHFQSKLDNAEHELLSARRAWAGTV